MPAPALTPRPGWTGGLLVGGGSTRMGRDKLILRHRGRTLSCLPAGALAQTCADLRALGRPAAELELPAEFHTLADARPAGRESAERRFGPLAGLLAALENAAGPWVLLCAGDMPDVRPGMLRALQDEAERDPERACFPFSPAGPEPAISAWPTSLAPLVRRRFEAGRRSLRRALPSGQVRAWPEAEWRAYAGDLNVFRNLNTPQDWESWSGSPVVES